MFKKLLEIRESSDLLSVANFQLLMNRWDVELEDYMKSAENKCHKFKNCHIEWSPAVGIWLKRRWLLARVQKHLRGGVKDDRNLIRDCLKQNIKHPRRITQAELDIQVYVCSKQLDELSKHAPALRRQHLKHLITKYQDKGDEHRAAILLWILHREACKKRWRRVNYSTKKPTWSECPFGQGSDLRG